MCIKNFWFNFIFLLIDICVFVFIFEEIDIIICNIIYNVG